jgi:hypothetical protein
MRVKLRILGVPLHPLLVHFPIAFWLVVPVLDIAALFAGPEPWWTLAKGATTLPRRSGWVCWSISSLRAAWNSDDPGVVRVHCKGPGCGALAACRMVNDRLSRPRSVWLRVARPRRLFRHAAGLPATRGGIAASPPAMRRVSSPRGGSCSNAPVGLRLRQRGSQHPQALRQRPPLS